MPIGDRIQQIREAKNLSLSDLARRLQTHPSNVQRWETNRVSPNTDTLQRIADALEVAPSELLEGEEMGLTLRSPMGPSPRRMFEEAPVRALYSLREPTDFEEETDSGVYRNLSRLMRLPRLSELRDAIAELPPDLSRSEIRQLAAMIRAFVENRPRRGRRRGRGAEEQGGRGSGER